MALTLEKRSGLVGIKKVQLENEGKCLLCVQKVNYIEYYLLHMLSWVYGGRPLPFKNVFLKSYKSSASRVNLALFRLYSFKVHAFVFR